MKKGPPLCLELCTPLLQLCVFLFGSFKNGDICIGVFPEREKILIRGPCFNGVALHGISTTELQMSQCPDGLVDHNSAMIEDFLKLRGCFAAVMRSKVRLASHIDRIQIGPVVKAECWQAKFIWCGGPKNLKRLTRIGIVEFKLGAKRWKIIELHDRGLPESLVQITFQPLLRLAR